MADHDAPDSPILTPPPADATPAPAPFTVTITADPRSGQVQFGSTSPDWADNLIALGQAICGVGQRLRREGERGGGGGRVVLPPAGMAGKLGRG